MHPVLNNYDVKVDGLWNVNDIRNILIIYMFCLHSKLIFALHNLLIYWHGTCIILHVKYRKIDIILSTVLHYITVYKLNVIQCVFFWHWRLYFKKKMLILQCCRKMYTDIYFHLNLLCLCSYLCMYITTWLCLNLIYKKIRC